MMIVMEGLMLVPPERGTIIGRALWKVGVLAILFQTTLADISVCPASICCPRQWSPFEDTERYPLDFGGSAQWAQRPEINKLEAKSHRRLATGG